MSSKIEYAKAGACFIGDDFQKCALDSTFCDVAIGEEYVSPAKLGLDGRSAPCNNVENIAVGKCVSNIDSSACTGHISSCILPNFIPVGSVADTGCSVTHNKNRDNDLSVSVYGACINQKTQNQKCYWSMDDCPDVPNINSFVPGSSQHLSAHYSPAKLCTCDRTLVGACQYPSGYTCAVSKDTCGVSGLYITAAEMEKDPSAPTCYLCAPFGKSNFSKLGETGRSQREKALITIVVLGLVACIAVAACVFRRRCCRATKAPQEFDGTKEISETGEELDTDAFAGTQNSATEPPKLNPII